MVDFLIGGITIADRNNLKASVEDAILNCRSASENGVGYGANFMAWKAINDIIEEDESNSMLLSLKTAYDNIIKILYSNYDFNTIKKNSFYYNCPMNLRNGKYDYKVKSSIKSDIVILETISKILTLMFTCNQYLTQTPMHNIYIDEK